MFRQDKYDELVARKSVLIRRLAALSTDRHCRAQKARMCSTFQSTGTSQSHPSYPARIPWFKHRMGRFVPPRRTTNTSTGNCPFGRNCMFKHDLNKVAICKEYLFKGSCSNGQGCDLSHDPTPNRTPACIYFSRGNCTNPDCRYTHVKIDADAPVCRDLATVGWCERGATCTERHVFECPDYANTGSCPIPKCHLPHVDHAGQLRKRAGVANAPSPTNSDKNDTGNDNDAVVDSDLEDFSPKLAHATPGGQQDASFSQQEDYIRFDMDG